MDDLIASGRPEMLRGVRGFGGKSAADLHEDMRSGSANYGHGIYGNGYYFGTHHSTGTADPQSFSDGTPGSVARATLHPRARVVDGNSIFGEYNTFMKGPGKEVGPLQLVYGDVGRYAAARGFDVIHIDPGKPNEQFVVLNRTALIVQAGD